MDSGTTAPTAPIGRSGPRPGHNPPGASRRCHRRRLNGSTRRGTAGHGRARLEMSGAEAAAAEPLGGS